MPSGKSSKIKSIVTYDEELEMAHMPMAVTLTLEDEIDISRGDMIVHSDNLPTSNNSFSANIVWMNETPLLAGKEYEFKQASRAFSGTISNIHYKVDVNTLETKPTHSLELNEIGLCDLNFSESIHFDSYSQNPSTGAFIIIDRLSNVTVGAGMVETATKKKRKIAESSTIHVTKEDRAARYGQKPVTVMFVGISGSGKSTLAHALEKGYSIWAESAPSLMVRTCVLELAKIFHMTQKVVLKTCEEAPILLSI